MAKAKWMAGAFKPEHRGEFTAKAKKAGMGAQAFADAVMAHEGKYSTHTIHQAEAAKAAQSVANTHKRRKLRRK